MKLPNRLAVVHGSLVAFAILLLGTAAKVQLWNGATWAAKGEHQQFQSANTPAPRGAVLNASGAPLVESRERLRLSIAPHDVPKKKRATVAAALARLNIPSSIMARARDTTQRWVVIPGRFLVAQVADLAPVTGIYLDPTVDRVSSAPAGALRLIGGVNADGAAVDGLELSLDAVLRGRGGTVVTARDSRGHGFESPSAQGETPTPGQTVVLTIRRDLQDIAEQAIADAVHGMHAAGGDILMLDPHTGEIAALAGYSATTGFTSGTAMTQPFEPGSTVKPLLMSRLFTLGRTNPDEVIETMNGKYQIPGRKTPIEDDFAAPRLTVREVLEKSSNIGMVRLAERLTPREEFEAYRDFGFGTPTGITFPSESPGVLRAPAKWSNLSASSMAMGYELEVTPLQLASAYGAIANGGELMEPSLIREVRTPAGDVVYHHEPRVVRRVMAPEIASTIRQMLIAVVDTGGTAAGAQLGTATLAGKTGTAKLSLGGRGYATNQYEASFVGLFPADDPQYVIFVKLDNPVGTYGGRTAAPVTKGVLQAAIVARDAALDRTKLSIRMASATTDDESDDTTASMEGRASVLVALGDPMTSVPPSQTPRAVPDVHGLPLRSAVYALHQAGFQVVLADGAGGAGTVPSAGSVQPPGTRVRLFTPQ